MLRSEIFIDRIARLEILTSTRRINVGDVEALHLQAYDSMDNVFSSLDGLPFDWANSATNMLKDISLTESGLVVSASVWELDRVQVSTNVYPVRGQTPGRVNISVALADPAYKVATRAEFLVIEPLWLKPANARMAPGSEMRVQLLTRFREDRVVHTDSGSTEESNELPAPPVAAGSAPTAFTSIHRREIAMPSAQYKWSSAADEIAWVHRDTGLVVARRTGSTRVSVTDVNAPEHTRASEVLVVEPESIMLELRALSSTGEPLESSATRRVQCDGSWFVQQGSAFELLIYLLDAQGYRIAVTPNMHFEFSFRGSSVARAGATGQASKTPTSPLPTDSAQAAPPSAQAFVPPSSSSIYLLASSLGTTTLSVSLSSIRSVAGGVEYQITLHGKPHALTQSAKIVVTDGVRFASEMHLDPAKGLVVPYVSPVVQPRYTLKAEGGSGRYEWRSSAEQVVSVQAGRNSSASVELVCAGPLPTPIANTPNGMLAMVIVGDACNPESSTGLPVQLAPPAAIRFLPLERQEAVVGGGADAPPGLEKLEVYIKVERHGGAAFDDCSALYLHASFPLGSTAFQISHPNSTTKLGAPPQPPVFRCINRCPVEPSINCFHIVLVAARVGFAQLRAQLVDSGSVQASPIAAVPVATEVFAAFAPLRAQPSPLLLGVGTAAVVSHSGGPLAWPQGGFLEQAGVEADEGAISLKSLLDAGAHASYPTPLEARFLQTYADVPADATALSSGVLSRSTLGQTAWISHDVSAASLLGVRVINDKQRSFEVTCLRAEEGAAPIAVHILWGNIREQEEGEAEFALKNPLVAHASVLVYCYPPLRMPRALSVGIGAHRTLEPVGAHPLASMLRFERDLSSAEAAAVVDVDRYTGVVRGRRLGQAFVPAHIDREQLLQSLGFSLPAKGAAPVYNPDSLQSRSLVSVEFDDFRIRLSNPRYASTLLLKGHTTLAYIVGLNGEAPVDESYEHVQCQWRVEGGGQGLAIAPVLSTSSVHALTSAASTDGDASTAASGSAFVYGCSIRLFGHRSGQYKLSMSIAVAMEHASAKSAFEQSIVVQVVEPLVLHSPASLLLPAGAVSHIQTNMHALVQQVASMPNATGLVHPTLTFKLLSYSCSLRPRPAAGGKAATEPHVPYVSVDDKGVISVRARTAEDAQADNGSADAVILVQSTHTPSTTDDEAAMAAALASEDDSFSLGASPLTQSLTIQVSVRPIAQLFIAPSSALLSSSLLCPGRNYSFALGIADPLGRKFDVYRADDFLGSLEANVSADAAQGTLLPGECSLSVQRMAPAPAGASGSAAAAADAQVLAQFTLQVGDSPIDKAAMMSGSAAHTLHVLQDFMLHFSLPSHPQVSSLFLQLYVAPTTALCAEPSPVLLQMRLALPPQSWADLPSHSVHRDQFVSGLSHDIAAALNLTGEAAARVRIYNVDPSSGSVDLLLLPKSFGAPFHRDQWFAAYFTPAQLEQRGGSASGAVAQTTESWLSAPFHLAQALQKQATDKTHSAALWQGALSRSLDEKSPFLTVEVSIGEAERLLRERRGSSSALSASGSIVGGGGADSSSTSASSSHSVWADEREMATWSRVLDQSARDNNPLATGATGKPSLTDAGDSSAASSKADQSLGDASAVGAGGEAPSADVLARRDEDEQRWRELKRRYEADRMREAGLYSTGGEWGAGSTASALHSLLYLLSLLLFTGLGLALGALYLYWSTFVATPVPVGAAYAGGRQRAGLNLPADQLRKMPEHSFVAYVVRIAREYACCGGGAGGQRYAVSSAAVGLMPGSPLLDPSLGPSDRSYQQQHRPYAVPPAEMMFGSPQRGGGGGGGMGYGGFNPSGEPPLQHIQHNWQ